MIEIPLPGLPPRLEFWGGLSKDFVSDLQYNFQFNSPSKHRLGIEANFSKPIPYQKLEKSFAPLRESLNKFVPAAIDYFETYIEDEEKATFTLHFQPKVLTSGTAEAIKLMAMRYAVEHDGIGWNIYGIGNGLEIRNKDMNPFGIRVSGYNYLQLDTLIKNLIVNIESNERVSDIDPEAVSGFSAGHIEGKKVLFAPDLSPRTKSDCVRQYLTKPGLCSWRF